MREPEKAQFDLRFVVDVYSSEMSRSRSVEMRLESLSAEVNKLRTEVAKQGGRLEGRVERRWIFPLITTVVTAIVVSYGGWLGLAVISMQKDIAAIQREIAPLRVLAVAEQLKAASASPSVENLTRMQQIVRAATDSGLLIGGDTIASVGKTLLDGAIPNPPVESVAWKTMLALADYRSFLNAKHDPDYRPGASPSEGVQIAPGSAFTVSDSIFNRLTQSLDWGIWKNVTFRDCVILYKGGPLTLQNVKFENCRFQIAPSSSARSLSAFLIASHTITVDLKG